MNDAQIHLLINHAPLFATFFGILLGLSGYWLRNKAMMQAGMLCLIAAAVTSLVANGTGEGAEELVEDLPGVSHKQIHQHEEAAEGALIAILSVGTLSLLAYVALWRDMQRARLYVLIVSITALASLTALAKVAHDGGLIRHPEIDSAVDTKDCEGIPKLKKQEATDELEED